VNYNGAVILDFRQRVAKVDGYPYKHLSDLFENKYLCMTDEQCFCR
jgi:hypothetical protein